MMTNLRKLAMGAVTGGLMSIGVFGMASAQTTTVPEIDADVVVEELNLDQERASELAPLLDRLNVLFERRQEHWEEGDQIIEELETTYDEIAETLSPTELREFFWLMRQDVAAPWSGRPMNRYMTGGRIWGGGWGPGMRGGRGYYRRGVPMGGTRGYAGRGVPLRDGRGGIRWNSRPGWRPDESNPKD